MPAPSIWAIPEDVDATPAQLAELARLLGMPLPGELNRELADEDKTFVWLKRQVDEPVAQQIACAQLRASTSARNTGGVPGRARPRPMAGFTNVEDKGQEGVELAFNRRTVRPSGSRRVIKDRMGRVVEDVGDTVPAGRAATQLSIDSKVQFFAYQKLRDAVQANKARAGGAWWCSDAVTGEVLALATTRATCRTGGRT